MPEPVRWGEGREAEFAAWIDTELRRALSARTGLETKWKDHLDRYRAPVSTEVKRFPFEGASNRTLPVSAMNVDPLLARYLTTLHAPANLWTLQPLNERWVDAAKPLQDHMQWLDTTQLNMFDVNYRAILEWLKLGTAIYKTGWFFESRQVRRYDFAGRLVEGEKLISQPFVDHVSLIDFIMPPYSYQIQADVQGGAPWIAERFTLRRDQLLARSSGQSPFLPNYNAERTKLVLQFEDSTRTAGAEVEDKRYSLDDYVPSHYIRVELYELWARFDTTGRGTVDDVVVIFHPATRTILRAIYNPYRHGLRPYDVARFIRGDGFYGIGLCEQSEVFQSLLSELLNYQVDNVLAANSKMIAVKFGANVVPGEPIYPLKIWALEDPSRDIREFSFSDVYPSLPTLGAIVQGWGERRTGVNDNQWGNTGNLPSRTPATTMLSMLQESNRRFDLSMKELRGCLGRVGMKLLQNLQQFLSSPHLNPEAENSLRIAVTALGEPEGQYVEQMLTLPIEEVEAGVGVSITATSGMANKEIEKQSFLALVQLQASLATQYLQLAQIIDAAKMGAVPPTLGETAGQLFRGFTELQRRLLEQYDVRNPEEILVSASALETANRAIAAGEPIVPAAAGALMGGSPNAGGPGLFAPMAGMGPAG